MLRHSSFPSYLESRKWAFSRCSCLRYSDILIFLNVSDIPEYIFQDAAAWDILIFSYSWMYQIFLNIFFKLQLLEIFWCQLFAGQVCSCSTWKQESHLLQHRSWAFERERAPLSEQPAQRFAVPHRWERAITLGGKPAKQRNYCRQTLFIIASKIDRVSWGKPEECYNQAEFTISDEIVGVSGQRI